MVIAALDPEIRQKVLSAYLDGHGRNQITRELHEQGIKISHGSVSNFINAYKRKHEQPPSPPEQQASSGSNNAGISTADKKNIGESSPLFSGKGKATSDSFVTPRDGGPLTHFFSGKDKDTMTTVADPISSTDGSPASLKVEDADVINSSEEPNTPSAPSDLTYSPAWDPDDEQAMQTRFLRVIIAEREKRHQEISLINKEKELIAYERRNLELEKKQLDYERRNLETRLAEVNKYRDILPSAKYLREMGVDFHEITIWIETIRDKAATEGIDHKSAVSLIVQDLKLYNQYNTLQKAIQKRQQDLEALNIALEQKQQAYRSLVNLRSKGI
jgi:hypothetical protein